VRRVASKVGALIALVMDWRSVIVHLESIAGTEKGNITAAAKGLIEAERFQVCIYDAFYCGLSVYSEQPFS
jgi:hypothetical protein